MHRWRLFGLAPALALAAALAAALALGAVPASAAPIIVKAAHLIDGVADRPRDGVAVLVDGDSIVAIGPAAELTAKAPGARVIDLGGATLLPGLIDAHTHVFLNDDVTTHIQRSGYRSQICGHVRGSVIIGAIFSAALIDSSSFPATSCQVFVRHHGLEKLGALASVPPRGLLHLGAGLAGRTGAACSFCVELGADRLPGDVVIRIRDCGARPLLDLGCPRHLG